MAEELTRIGLVVGKPLEVELNVERVALVLSDADRYAGFTVKQSNREKRVYVSPDHVAYVEEILPGSNEAIFF